MKKALKNLNYILLEIWRWGESMKEGRNKGGTQDIFRAVQLFYMIL